MENRLAVLGSFLAKTKGRAIAAKFYDEITRLKKVCIRMDIIVERLRRRPPFLYRGSKRAIKRRSTTVAM